jgi:hypothetical protein
MVSDVIETSADRALSQMIRCSTFPFQYSSCGYSNSFSKSLKPAKAFFSARRKPGFTPVKGTFRWIHSAKVESRNEKYESAASLKGSLFGLKNPHNIPARRFALKVEEHDTAIRH